MRGALEPSHCRHMVVSPLPDNPRALAAMLPWPAEAQSGRGDSH